MSCSRLYFGEQNFCIIIKKNEDVTDAEFLVYDEASGAPQDLTGTEHKITVYDRPYGKQLYTANLVQASNSLKWTFKYTDIGLTIGSRYHEISFIDSQSDLKIIGFGDFKII